MNELQRTKEWFEQAIPEPTPEQACIQVGCHLEEVVEMMEAINMNGTDAFNETLSESNSFKEGFSYWEDRVEDCDDVGLLDSLVDQIVTAMGVGHMKGYDMLSALAEVNRSNFSKFEDGKAVFNESGKIKKGKHYSSPDLSNMIGN